MYRISAFFLYFIIAVLVLFTWQFIRFRSLISVGKRLSSEAAQRIYEQHPREPSLRLVHIGDSTVVGTGATSVEGTITAQLGRAYPDAEIINMGVNGARTADVRARLEALPEDEHVDILIIQVGANDIVRRSRLIPLEQDLRRVVDVARAHADTVVLLHGGDVGSAPIFPAGIDRYLSRYTARVRAIWMRVAAEKHVTYVDLWREKQVDPFYLNPSRMYAADQFHPSDAGYADWYAHIHSALQQLGY